MNISALNTIESILIPHTAFERAKTRILAHYDASKECREPFCLAVVGESRTGKSRVLEHVGSTHPTVRTKTGVHIPILIISAPSKPTVKSLAEILLCELGDPMWNSRGSENEKTERLIILLKRTNTTMVIIEEFQHFYDKTSHKIQHHVADWLKILVDRARLGLVVSGLPECTAVISQNEQLSGRFSGAIEMPRFDWTEVSHNNDFKLILGAFRDALPTYGFPDLSSENMVFRFYCATGGLIGYMVKIFKETLLKAEAEGRVTVSLSDLAVGYQDAIWQCGQRIVLNPFLLDFDPTPSPYILDLAREVGTKEMQMEPQVRYVKYKPKELTAAEALSI